MKTEQVIEAFVAAGMDPADEAIEEGRLLEWFARFDAVRPLSSGLLACALHDVEDSAVRLAIVTDRGVFHVETAFPDSPLGLRMFAAAVNAA